MRFYVICTYSSRGRYVLDGTTDRRRAEDKARKVTAGYMGDGYELTEPTAQRVREPVDDDTPAVVIVWHLRAPGGDWLNVEVYEIQESE